MWSSHFVCTILGIINYELYAVLYFQERKVPAITCGKGTQDNI